MERVITPVSRYEAGYLMLRIEDLMEQEFTGVAYFTPESQGDQDSSSFVAAFKQGKLIYCGRKLLSSTDFVKALCQKLNPNLANVALNYVLERSGQLSLGMILSQLVRIRVLSWAQIESFLKSQAIQILDLIQGLPGQIRPDTTQYFDLAFELDQTHLSWPEIRDAVLSREQVWRSLARQLPDKNVVPILLSHEVLPQDLHSEDPQLCQQFNGVTNGQRSLFDIAEVLDRDPLDVARFYAGLIEHGIATVVGHSSPTQSVHSTPSQSTILTVDDSPIVQVMLKRTLSDHYRVLSATHGAAALELLAIETVHLAILDVTMPDVSGLDLCRLIRQIPQYKKLPILMLTARDGYTDRLKGHIAGSTQYLTKPVESEKLLDIVQSYLNPQFA